MRKHARGCCLRQFRCLGLSASISRFKARAWRDAIQREVKATRSAAGMCDMSSLGKVDVQGADALTFIERVYCNNLAKLKPGRVRYSLMLREDGLVLDDGTVTCLGEGHYLLTLTTAHSGRVWLHLEKLRQAHWPELDVKLTSVTDHWASLALAGPRAREVLAALGPGFDIASEAFPVLSVREGEVAGLPARVFRVSFSGELGFEINVPAGFASLLWQRVSEAGAAVRAHALWPRSARCHAHREGPCGDRHRDRRAHHARRSGA